jgi:hypothetical protein
MVICSQAPLSTTTVAAPVGQPRDQRFPLYPTTCRFNITGFADGTGIETVAMSCSGPGAPVPIQGPQEISRYAGLPQAPPTCSGLVSPYVSWAALYLFLSKVRTGDTRNCCTVVDIFSAGIPKSTEGMAVPPTCSRDTRHLDCIRNMPLVGGPQTCPCFAFIQQVD